jgi:hypothetical protein
MKPAIWTRSTEKYKKSSFFLTLPPSIPTIRFRLQSADRTRSGGCASEACAGIRPKWVATNQLERRAISRSMKNSHA